ncbi:hypothetical protein PW52_04265 [Tamlana sedimentorum]|uniref:Secretion system C-terminal sorting domain-containing protein n=1 Tax=Neotamlana sedimentorum TaxID=1435349 RepID=A0A0D7WGI3_9FLAO|nr:hypothetical protein [Tamlana sedimentorum]KJD36852.1 hypothetical protein PW52_04265 [Tamlana sedimentorum]
MKNVIKNTKKGFLMVTMFATLLSFANESANVIVTKNAKKTVITLQSVKEGNKLTIIDANGVILYKEVIAETGNYQKAFDFTSLPDGNYTVELDKDLEIDTMPFSVSASEVVFNNDSKTVTYKPYARLENGVVYVSKLSLNEAPLEVNIYDANSDLVYSDNIDHKKNIQKAYKLEGLGNNHYKLVFKTEGKIFTQNI